MEGGEGGWLALGDGSDGRASARATAAGATWAKAASEGGVARVRQTAAMASGEGEGGQREQRRGDGAARVHAVLVLAVQGGPPEPSETRHVIEAPAGPRSWVRRTGRPVLPPRSTSKTAMSVM